MDWPWSMSNRLSIIQYMQDIQTEPQTYAHGELPEDLLAELSDAWPDRDTVLRGRDGDNLLFQYQARDSLSGNKISPIWREFVEYHTSQEFLDELFDWCGEYFCDEIKQLPRKGGVRFVTEDPIKMETQFCIDTPSVNNPVVKPMHLDNALEFYKFLIRFPSHGYDTGGKLNVGKWKEGKEMSFIPNTKHFSTSDSVDIFATLPISGIIFFLNSPNALHGVDERIKNNGLYRRYVNIVGESAVEVFDPKTMVGGRGEHKLARN